MAQQQLAEEFARVLTRYRSVHNLHRQTGVSQESLRRMERGRPPRVDVVENFAREVGEDVNHWREIAGYPPVPTGDHADCERMRAIHRGLQAIRDELGVNFSIDAHEMLEAGTLEEIDAFLSRVRQREGQRRASDGEPAREREGVK